jgi:hypothetical protein
LRVEGDGSSVLEFGGWVEVVDFGVIGFEFEPDEVWGTLSVDF